MPLANVWEVKVIQEFPGVDEVLNVYHLYTDPVPEDVVVWLTSLETALVDNIRPVQTSALKYKKMVAVNLGDPLKGGEWDLAGQAGSGGVAPNPKFMAWSIRVIRGDASMRHGYKRFCGVDEIAVSSAAPTSTIVTAFTGTIIPGLTGSPAVGTKWVVVKRIKYTTAGGKDAWRLPENDSELTYYDANTVVFQGLTTQNTRKR